MLAQLFRPLRFGIVVSLLALSLLIAGCAQEQGEQGAEELVTGSFVGETSDPVTAVAVIVGEPAEGESSREVRALIYGDTDNPVETDGVITPISEWFVGSAAGNDLDLSSEGGAQFQGELTPEGATGTITLPDGTPVPFDAAPATGVAGYYDVTLTPDGQVTGTSASGARMEGQLEEERARQIPGETREHGIVPLTGTVTPPDGQPQDFEVDFLTAPPVGEEPIPARFVVLNDGTIKGGARKGSGSQFTCPLID